MLAFTPREEVRNQLALTWGVQTFVTPAVDTTDEMVEQVDLAMLEIPGYEPGDTVVIVAGAPPNTSGSTNLIRVHRLGHATTDVMPATGRRSGGRTQRDLDIDGVPRGQAGRRRPGRSCSTWSGSRTTCTAGSRRRCRRCGCSAGRSPRRR